MIGGAASLVVKVVEGHRWYSEMGNIPVRKAD